MTHQREPSHRAQPSRRPQPASPARPDPAEQESFWRRDPRPLFFVLLAPLTAVSWFVHDAAHGSPTRQAAGVLGIVLAILVVVSYLLRRRSHLFAGGRWQQTRTARVARLVLIYAWVAYFVVLYATMLALWVSGT